VTVPFFHISGINACFLLNLCVGGKVIILPKWNADEAVALIDQEKVTRFWGVPTMSAELSAAADKAGSTLNTLGTIDAGGAKRPPSQVKGLAGQFSQAQPATGFGMTETNGLGIRMAGDEYIAHPGAAGRLTPPVQAMRIVDEDGSPVPSGDVGELQLKSAANMRCYLNQPEATAATLSEGWLKTGDLAYADETGLVFIVGRKKDIVIRGGENIACTEVEAALYQVSSGIKEASVFSIPDDRLGETVGAALYVEETVDIAMLNGDLKTILAKFKLPERYWIYAERLPRGATEKIDKRQIRDSCLAGEVPEADTSSR
jgi:acyl-CoA synthetase (AMP-forming)/AMP-acid ligase II